MSDTSYAVYQHYGTNAQRLAFTPSPPSSGQPIYVWYETDTDKVFLYTTGWHQIASSSSGSAISALTGDVTATGPGSVAATIANSAVTLAKIANAGANSKLLGSGATGSGSPYSEITLGSGLTMTGTTLSASGGGGGTTTYTSAYSSPPASPASGDLWLPSDGFAIYRYSGSAWMPWGQLQPFDLTNAPSTWANQGTATIDTSRGPIVLTNNGGTSVAMRVKSAPATPYTITIRARTRVAYGVGQIQLGWRDSASGKLTAVALLGNGTLEIQKWNGPTSFNANYTTSTAYFDTYPVRPDLWLRIKDDGVTRYYQISMDSGVTWDTLHSVGRTDFLTADQVYFGVDNESAVSPYSVLTLYSWVEA